MTPETWDGLAWWQQQMYVEGYIDEGLIEPNGSPEEGVVTNVQQSGGSTITDRKFEQTLSLEPGEFAAFGITEHTLT
jgi:hypothetical protein